MGLFYFMLPLLLLLVGCDSGNSQSKPAGSIDTWYPLRVGDREIDSQVAIHTTEQRRGLMFRQELAPDSGMLFAYTTPQRVSFYMKNTPVPLDLGLFDKDGVLREIHRMMPYDTASTISNSDQIQFCLEMNQGWFSRNQLYPGTRLDLTLLAQALRGRGADAVAYGLPAGR